LPRLKQGKGATGVPNEEGKLEDSIRDPSKKRKVSNTSDRIPRGRFPPGLRAEGKIRRNTELIKFKKMLGGSAMNKTRGGTQNIEVGEDPRCPALPCHS